MATRRFAIRRTSIVPALPQRPDDAHKGQFGRVLVIGGSRGMIGAPALAANAALRSGAGLVTVACPASIQPAVAILCPCATTVPLPENARGQLSPERAMRQLRNHGFFTTAGIPTVVAAGPGLDEGTEAFNRAWRTLVTGITRRNETPVVMDADGLNALAPLARRSRPTRRASIPNVVITPHPGEMAKLLRLSTSEIQADRERAAIDAAHRLSGANAAADEPDCAVAVLKGRATVVTDGNRVYINRTGNAGMATGGSGDVLTGIIAALIGQGMHRFNATILGVHLHGKAGDAALKAKGSYSLIASDLVDFLPSAFQQKRD